MPEDKNSFPCLLTGEIIEIYERNKMKFAKIKFDPGYMDICIDKIDDAHLNDKLVINGQIQIIGLAQNVDEDNFSKKIN